MGLRLAKASEPNPAIVLNGRDHVSLTVPHPFGLGSITEAWAEIQGPTTFPGAPLLANGSSVAGTGIRKIPLTSTNSGMTYAAELGGLSCFGVYGVTVFARTADGVVVPIQRNRFLQDAGADVFEPDNTRETASPLTVNAGAAQEHSLFPAGDVDWVVFHAFASRPLAVTFSPLAGEGVVDVVVKNEAGIDLERYAIPLNPAGEGVSHVWKAPKDGIYYLRIGAANPAATPGYGLSLTWEVQPPLGAYIYGRVFDAAGGVIRDAVITTTDGASAVVSPDDGVYLMSHSPGSLTMTVTAQGYQPVSVSMTLGNWENRHQDVYLTPTAPPILPPNTLPSSETTLSEPLIMPLSVAVEIPPGPFRVNETIKLSARVTGGLSGYQFLWEVGKLASFTPSGEHVTIRTLSPGKLKIHVTVKDSASHEVSRKAFLSILPDKTPTKEVPSPPLRYW